MGLKKTPLSRGNATLKKSPLKKKGNSFLKSGGKIKVKPKTEEQKEERQKLYEIDKAFYLSIWESMELPRRCFETDKLLPSEPLLTMFHHLLYKQVYPEYRHSKWNIVVILPEVHSQTHTDSDKTPKIKALTLELKQKCLNGEL